MNNAENILRDEDFILSDTRWFWTVLSMISSPARVAWELTSESLHESFLDFHCLVKRDQELRESWQARVCMRVFSTFIAWSNENKSCTRVDES
jgi:hypothetical protein